MFRRFAESHAIQERSYRTQQPSKDSTAEAGRKQAEMWRRRAEATRSKSAAEAAEAAVPAIDLFAAQARELGAKADYHASLRRKYEIAASRPWVSVPPDAPPPIP